MLPARVGGRCSIGIVLAVLACVAPGAAYGANYRVIIEGTSFNPPTLKVKSGDTVVWVKDPFPHTATSRGGRFDSRTIAPEKSWRYRTRKAGVFPYFCTLHPTMKGTLVVE